MGGSVSQGKELDILQEVGRNGGYGQGEEVDRMQLSFRCDMRRLRARVGSNHWLQNKITVPGKGVSHLFLI